MCIKCGLYDAKIDPIKCDMKNAHTPPCGDCQDSFQVRKYHDFYIIDHCCLILTQKALHMYQVLAEMHELHKIAKQEAQKKYQQEPSLEDDMSEMKKQLDNFLNNLIDYRAHLVHKHSEGVFDTNFYGDLEDAEVVVICDWKMKILSSKFREAQQEWFSKRGTSLLGFEIHLDSKGQKRDVHYHFFITDDATQDTEAVLCAKHYLYSEVLPKYGIKKVNFRSDGAACFSSKEAKASMVLFDDISRLT